MGNSGRCPQMISTFMMSQMARSYEFVFTAEPEGGYTVTCPALPGLVTYGRTLAEAKDMARDAAKGMIGIMREQGIAIPEGNAPASKNR